jgi:tRNA C32,U32 (ribose-2'-O)-methylase TrmJ
MPGLVGHFPDHGLHNPVQILGLGSQVLGKDQGLVTRTRIAQIDLLGQPCKVPVRPEEGVLSREVDRRIRLAVLRFLGGEDKGLTEPVRKRCDTIVGVPLRGQLESLNVSVTAGVLFFERVRQQHG